MHAYQECDWETRVLDKNAIDLGDKVLISPLSGNKKSFELKRTQVDFVSENFRGETGAIVKKLPTMKSDTIHLRLSRCEQRNYLGSVVNRYILQTLNGRPFWHNGSLVFSIIVTDQDEIEIGYNRLKFQKAALPVRQCDELSKHIKIIRSQMPILMEGKTGTGKSTLAKKIHKLSDRVGDFVHINLSAYSENLIESELFGHVRGAFTGALNDKKGAIARANNGTLFLDEIDSTSIATQVKLLLFLDHYKITPVGSCVQQKVNCRIILAAGSNLMQKVEKGQMRLDFYHRISSGQSFKLKSLQEAPENIISFCREFERKNNVTIEDKLLEYYQKVQWSGNYRQLQGHLERKRILASGSKIVWSKDDEHLLVDYEEDEEEYENVVMLSVIKDKYCIKTYFRYQKNMTLAAQKLGISIKCLRAVLQRNGLR